MVRHNGLSLRITCCMITPYHAPASNCMLRINCEPFFMRFPLIVHVVGADVTVVMGHQSLVAAGILSLN